MSDRHACEKKFRNIEQVCLKGDFERASRGTDWLIKLYFWTVKILAKNANFHICRCCSTTNNEDIHGEILWLKDIDKYSINNNI